MNPEKWQKVASYQEKRADQVVRCHLCPHRCVLQQGAAGICKTRINQSGTLYTTAYGNPCSLSIDPIEKKPLFHFMPGQPVFSLATGGCNFRCLNCQNWQISQVSPQSLNGYDLDPDRRWYYRYWKLNRWYHRLGLMSDLEVKARTRPDGTMNYGYPDPDNYGGDGHVEVHE